MNIWDKPGHLICPLCKKGKAQLSSGVVEGRYTQGCWKFLYK